VPALLALAFTNGYWMALISSTVWWFGAAFVAQLFGLTGDIARSRVAVDGRDRSGTVIAALQTAWALGTVVAPLVGGWLYQQTGQLRPAMLLHLPLGLATTWVLWRYVREEVGGGAPGGPDSVAAQPAREKRKGDAGAIGIPLLLLLGAVVWYRLGDSRGPFETIYAAEALGASKAQVGALLTTFFALQLVLTPMVGVLADRIGAGVVTAMGIAVMGAHGVLLAGTTAFWQQMALVALPAFGLAIVPTVAFVYAQQLAPRRASTATGWLNTCFFLGLAAGSPLAGRVVELTGFRGLFVFSGAMDFSAAALVGALTLGLLIRKGSPARRSPG
jgi:MFS family permease